MSVVVTTPSPITQVVQVSWGRKVQLTTAIGTAQDWSVPEGSTGQSLCLRVQKEGLGPTFGANISCHSCFQGLNWNLT